MSARDLDVASGSGLKYTLLLVSHDARHEVWGGDTVHTTTPDRDYSLAPTIISEVLAHDSDVPSIKCYSARSYLVPHDICSHPKYPRCKAGRLSTPEVGICVLCHTYILTHSCIFQVYHWRLWATALRRTAEIGPPALKRSTHRRSC